MKQIVLMKRYTCTERLLYDINIRYTMDTVTCRVSAARLKSGLPEFY